MAKIIANLDLEEKQRYFYQRHRKLFKQELFWKDHYPIHNPEEYDLQRLAFYTNLKRAKLNKRFTDKSLKRAKTVEFSLDSMLKEVFDEHS